MSAESSEIRPEHTLLDKTEQTDAEANDADSPTSGVNLCADALNDPEVVWQRSPLATTLGGAGGEERKRIVEALSQCAGNQTQAAKLLGIGRTKLVGRLNEYNLPRPRKRQRSA